MLGWNESAWFSIFVGVALKSTAVLGVLWAVGAAAAFTHMLVTCAAVWRLRRRAKASPDSPLSRELARELGISHAVEVLEASAGTMPMTFGIVRPAVFLPCDAAGWSEERRRV